MILKNLLMAGLLFSTLTNVSYAVVHGGDSGGGGDASEARVDDIRKDILKWIIDGGATSLELPQDLSYDVYVEKMKSVLVAKKVIVSFTEKEVKVGKASKTCKGYVDLETKRKNILCNIPRFQKTSESAQYSLIHHEYAGLVNVEKNDGESSDYVISNQLTDYLVEQVVLKLAIKRSQEEEDRYYNPPREILKNVAICSVSCNDEMTGRRMHSLARIGTIYYADASNPGNLSNSNECMSNAKEVEVFSNRMDDRSVQNCAKAMIGTFYEKSVNIDTMYSPPGEEDTWFLSIKASAKNKK